MKPDACLLICNEWRHQLITLQYAIWFIAKKRVGLDVFEDGWTWLKERKENYRKNSRWRGNVFVNNLMISFDIGAKITCKHHKTEFDCLASFSGVSGQEKVKKIEKITHFWSSTNLSVSLWCIWKKMYWYKWNYVTKRLTMIDG